MMTPNSKATFLKGQKVQFFLRGSSSLQCSQDVVGHLDGRPGPWDFQGWEGITSFPTA